MHVISITCCSAFGVGHLVLFMPSELGVGGACFFITCCSASGVGHFVLFLLS